MGRALITPGLIRERRRTHPESMKLFPISMLLCWIAVSPLRAEKIVLAAGGGAAEKDAPAMECRLREPFGVEFLPSGEMLIAEMTGGNRVLRVDAGGVLRVIAGTGAKGFSGDGNPAVSATFNGLHNFVVLENGDLLLADSFNHAIRKIDARSGIVTTFAGDGRKGFRGDGAGAGAAQFDTPIQIALDPTRKNLFVADIGNKRVRRIVLATGIVSTVAGNGRAGVPPDGALAVEAPLADPRAVAAGADGSFYILERSGNALRFVDAAGRIRTVAGTGKAGLNGDGGPALEAALNGPKYIALDRDGSVLIADAENHAIRRYTPKDGKIARVAGTGKQGRAGLGGDPLACELARPHGVTVAPDGSLYITDSYNDRILKIVP